MCRYVAQHSTTSRQNRLSRPLAIATPWHADCSDPRHVTYADPCGSYVTAAEPHGAYPGGIMNASAISSAKWALVVALPVVVLSSPATAAGVQARFDLSSRGGSPFPTDRFARPDASNNTGLRVDLPKTDCATHTDDCTDLDLLKTLDG